MTATVEASVRACWAGVAKARQARGDFAGAAIARQAVKTYQASHAVASKTTYADGSFRGVCKCYANARGTCAVCVADAPTASVRKALSSAVAA